MRETERQKRLNSTYKDCTIGIVEHYDVENNYYNGYISIEDNKEVFNNPELMRKAMNKYQEITYDKYGIIGFDTMDKLKDQQTRFYVLNQLRNIIDYYRFLLWEEQIGIIKENNE